MPVSPAHQIPWAVYEAWARQQWTLHHPDADHRVQYQDLAAASGYGPTRLTRYKRDGSIPAYAARDLARGLHADPVTALAHFTPLDLLHHQAPPTPAQWLTQLTPAELHAELLRRLGHPAAPATPNPELPGAHPWATALLDGPADQPAGARGQRRKHAAAEILGIPYNTLRTKERRGSWTIPELYALCEWTGWSLRLGLAVTGWLTWDELDLDPQDRYAALADIDGAQLVDVIEQGLPALRETLENT